MRSDVDSILMEKEADAILMFSDSIKNPNMYYMTRFLAPDQFVFLKRLNNEPMIVVNTMEFSRAKKESIVKDVKSFSDYNYHQILKSTKNSRRGMIKMLASIVEKELGKKITICVPHDFPSIITDFLRNEDLLIKPMFSIIEKARETKEQDEVYAIKKVQNIVEKVVNEIVDLIAECKIDSNGTLVYGTNKAKKALTVGSLKTLMGHKFVDAWCSVGEDIIVANGPPSSDPHFCGNLEDKIKANQPIILDVFPRNIKSRYWTDMTRTIVKGKASKRIRKMFESVLETKNMCIDALHEGVLGNDVFKLCCNIFEKAGFNTIRGGKKTENGFIHSLGHGVGLQIHEEPSLSEMYSLPLNEHNVITVEPGLYHPREGGVRIEDIVEITKNGCNNLTKMPIELEV